MRGLTVSSRKHEEIQPDTGTTIKAYYSLTKPGIIYGNSLSLLAGFAVASRGVIDGRLLAASLIGTALIIAAGCVLNNYIDRGIDSKMTRTKQRALVSGRIPPKHALIFAGLLSLTGFGVLAWFTNLLTIYAGILGLYTYVVAYGIAKRRTALGTIIGSIAGATPILAGYTAASGRLDVTAGLLFLLLVLWQMPHFYAIAMYRLHDYRSAGIPVLPLVHGIRRTKVHIMVYIAAFGAASLALSLMGPTGTVFASCMAVVTLVWIWKGWVGLKANDDIVWARRMFRFSLLVLLLFTVLLIADPFLP